MLLISHTSMGILIASCSANPFTGSIMAFFSHYLLDIIPHEPQEELFFVPPKNEGWSEEIKTKLKKRQKSSIFDFIFSILLILSYLLITHENELFKIIPLFLIIFFSVLPDILTILYLRYPLKLLKEHYKFHYIIHNIIPIKMSYFFATTYQVVFSLLLLWLAVI